MKQRVISAVIAFVICAPIVYWGGDIYKLGVLILGLLGLKEIITVSKEKTYPKVISFIYYLLTGMLILLTDNTSIETMTLVAIIIPCIILVFYDKQKKYNIYDAFYLLGIVMLIGISFRNLIILREKSLMILLYLFIIAAVTDTYAYFGGSLIGKKKLMPSISPKKTWEGSITGTIFGTLVASLFYYIVIGGELSGLPLLTITLLLSILGQIGDLFFSSIKRYYKIKDFSNIMPGHGGVLDRLDSIIFITTGYIILINLF